MGNIVILKAMGERIYCRRKELKLTQDELAEKMGVSTQMISNLELGKKAIRPENLIKLCSELNISADYILTGKKNILCEDNAMDKYNLLKSEHKELIDELIDFMLSKEKKL